MNVSKGSIFGVVAAGTAVALTLAGCATAGSTSPSSSASAPPVALTGWKSASPDQIKQGGKVVLPIDQPAVNFNPLNAEDGTADTNTMSQLLLPSFVKLNPDGSWKADPNFAESVKLVSTNPQVVEVKINPKAVWQDGSPLTAADVIGTFKALSGKDKAYSILSSSGYDVVKSVEQGSSPTDVKITWATKYADWVGTLGVILPKELYSTAKGFNTAWKKQPTNTAGPFQFKSWDANAQIATYVPNPKWWGDKPKLDQIVFRVVNADSSAQSFANAEIDTVDVTDAASYATAAAAKNSTVEQSGGLTWRHLTINGKNPILADANVRHAIALAINRDVIAQLMSKAVHAKATTQDSLIYMPGQKGYDNAFKAGIGSSSVANAKALLTKAGWTAGSDGVLTKAGKKFSIGLSLPAGVPVAAQVGQLIQNDLKAVGITVKLVNVQGDQFFTDIIKGDFDTTTFVWQGTAFPISSAESLFYPANSGQNFGFITDPTLGADWKAANAELDPAKQVVLAQAIDKKINKLATIIPLAPRPNVTAVRTGLVNYGPTMFQTIEWEHIGWAK